MLHAFLTCCLEVAKSSNNIVKIRHFARFCGFFIEKRRKNNAFLSFLTKKFGGIIFFSYLCAFI